MLNKTTWISVFMVSIAMYAWIAYVLIKYSIGD